MCDLETRVETTETPKGNVEQKVEQYQCACNAKTNPCDWTTYKADMKKAKGFAKAAVTMVYTYRAMTYPIYKAFSLIGFKGTCMYTPSCSQYMVEAVQKKGFIKGFFKGLYRILRCNPFSKGGYDPVE